jgi:hypothetical protein
MSNRICDSCGGWYLIYLSSLSLTSSIASLSAGYASEFMVMLLIVDVVLADGEVPLSRHYFMRP